MEVSNQFLAFLLTDCNASWFSLPKNKLFFKFLFFTAFMFHFLNVYFVQCVVVTVLLYTVMLYFHRASVDL